MQCMYHDFCANSMAYFIHIFAYHDTISRGVGRTCRSGPAVIGASFPLQITLIGT